MCQKRTIFADPRSSPVSRQPFRTGSAGIYSEPVPIGGRSGAGNVPFALTSEGSPHASPHFLAYVEAVGRDFPEVFGTIKRNVPSCGDRESCVIGMQRDSNTQMWETYCLNSEVLNPLVHRFRETSQLCGIPAA